MGVNGAGIEGLGWVAWSRGRGLLTGKGLQFTYSLMSLKGFHRRLGAGNAYAKPSPKDIKDALAAKAVKKLGPLAADEMFTFEPALALGGAERLKYIVKAKLMPQLSFLAQLH
jgi:hypothetical protein